MVTLITGANGFVAGYLIPLLRSCGHKVVGVDLAASPLHDVDKYYSANLMDRDEILSVLNVNRPRYIVHLAAVSSVGKSWEAPMDAFLNNTNIFLNIVESVRELQVPARILSVGSSEEYGNVPATEMPLRETHSLAPCNPYAVARVAQEQLSRLYAVGYGQDIVMTRSFNQFGPGQKPIFFVPSMIQQIQEGRKKNEGVEIVAGDLSIVRDFLDVRDAVSAYRVLLEKGQPGEVYNVCSGYGRPLSEVLDAVARLLNVELRITQDPSRIRPVDNHVIVGDNSKLSSLGWRPEYDFDSTLRDMLCP